jgi:putative restriction endonuclease
MDDFTQDILDYYKHKITHLRVDRSKGVAPHKPILLLAIIELIEYEKLSENKIYPTPLIISTFLKYWSRLNFETHRNNVSLPFFHLKSEGFWHLYPNKGYERVLELTKSIRTFSELRKIVNYVSIDDNLFLIFSDKTYRESMRECIIETYFQDKRGILVEIFKESEEMGKQQTELIADSLKKFIPIKEGNLSSAKRNNVFRNTIMSIYDYTCSICKMQVITIDGASIVDAAHIIPFSTSHSNDIRNGFALCKNHHWCFDRGLITVDLNYKIDISPLVDDSEFLTDLNGKTILLPRISKLYPSEDAFKWHREHIFQI